MTTDRRTEPAPATNPTAPDSATGRAEPAPATGPTQPASATGPTAPAAGTGRSGDARPPQSAAATAVALLTRRGQHLACAESLTGGLVAAAITGVPGASAVFTSGIVAYTPAVKTALLAVPGELIDSAGVVSAEVAAALASGAREQGRAEWGIGTTGAAGPESHGGQPPGTVWIAVAEPSGLVATRMLTLAGGREEVRRDTVAASLELLLERLDPGGQEFVAPAE